MTTVTPIEILPEATIATPEAYYLLGLLSNKQIDAITIIDDAFDLYPSYKDFNYNQLEELLADAQKESLFGEFIKAGFDISDVNDIDDNTVKWLWDQKNSATPIGILVENYLGHVMDEKTDPLNTFCELLENELSVKITKLGSKDDFTCTDAKIIFIDYYLGANLDKDAVENSIKLAKNIYDTYADKPNKPLIVLMSTQDISETVSTSFRDESGLLGGMFEFISKKDIANRNKIILKLGAIAQSLPLSCQIQHFVEAIEKGMKEASTKFIQGIKRLGLEDYVYIQKLSLQEDGHPLGDYMLWLYSAYFGHLLFEENAAINDKQKELDKLTFAQLTPCQKKPTLNLAEIYKSALFSRVDDVGDHPRTPDGLKNTYLNLGDLFIKDHQNDVLMVINAQCDLSFAPDNKSRLFRPNRTILLIQGKLHPLSDKIYNEADKNKVRTELFDYEGKAYKILWDTKSIISQTYGRIRSWLKLKGYKRESCLRLPFALEVQHAFASDLTRVGMPVSPPIYKPVKVCLFRQNVDKKYRYIKLEQEESAFIVLHKDGDNCILPVDLVYEIREKIIANLQEDLASLTTDIDAISAGDRQITNKRKQQTSLQGKIDKHKIDHAVWMSLITPFVLLDDKDKAFDKLNLIVTKSKKIDGDFIGSSQFILNIVGV